MSVTGFKAAVAQYIKYYTPKAKCKMLCRLNLTKFDCQLKNWTVTYYLTIKSNVNTGVDEISRYQVDSYDII